MHGARIGGADGRRWVALTFEEDANECDEGDRSQSKDEEPAVGHGATCWHSSELRTLVGKHHLTRAF